MEIHNSNCKAVESVALLHSLLKLIAAWRLGLETFDHLIFILQTLLDERDSSFSFYDYQYIILALGQGGRCRTANVVVVMGALLGVT